MMKLFVFIFNILFNYRFFKKDKMKKFLMFSLDIENKNINDFFFMFFSLILFFGFFRWLDNCLCIFFILFFVFLLCILYDV